MGRRAPDAHGAPELPGDRDRRRNTGADVEIRDVGLVAVDACRLPGGRDARARVRAVELDELRFRRGRVERPHSEHARLVVALEAHNRAGLEPQEACNLLGDELEDRPGIDALCDRGRHPPQCGLLGLGLGEGQLGSPTVGDVEDRATDCDEVPAVVGQRVLDEPVVVVGAVGMWRRRLARDRLAPLADRPLEVERPLVQRGGVKVVHRLADDLVGRETELVGEELVDGLVAIVDSPEIDRHGQMVENRLQTILARRAPAARLRGAVSRRSSCRSDRWSSRLHGAAPPGEPG